MPSNSKKQVVLFLIIITIFIFGVVRLFTLRFETGDIYPAYSSLRSDPLGTKAFYKSLNSIKNLSIDRNYQPVHLLHLKENTTFFYLGASTSERDFYNKRSIKALEQIATTGGRLVISFIPQKKIFQHKEDKPDQKKKTGQEDPCNSIEATSRKTANKPDQGKEPVSEKKTAVSKDKTEEKSLTKKWGYSLAYETEQKGFGNAVLVDQDEENSFLPTVSWHTTLYFDKLHESWKTIYTHNNHPVVIEKKLKNGSIVLCSGSYFFSNEALLKERHANLLSWFIGPNQKISFDESHFGVLKRQGVVDLARKYRLHWVFLVAVLYAGLFIWKNSVHFIPPPKEREIEGLNDLTSLHDHTECFIGLLRRNFRKDDILPICVEEWKKSFIKKGKVTGETAGKIDSINALLANEKSQPVKHKDPVKTYKMIHQILAKRKML